ncbi:MAG: ATP-binding cassette domain-containing protein, partial [Actinomycetes bacterium]
PADDDRVWEALRDAQVHDVVQRLSEGLDTQLGERGVRLSGGEVQRIGLARALYRKPALLVLDEATSSLDAATESRVAEAVDRLSADVTVITIAHRLATVRRADLVVLVDGGHVLGTGTFNEMVERHPNFASAAALQGLTAAHDEQIPVPDRV